MSEPDFTALALSRVATEHERDATTVTATFRALRTGSKGGRPGESTCFEHLPTGELARMLEQLMVAYLQRRAAVTIKV